MSLQILIAGCLPKERDKIEGMVKKALGPLPESEPWSVSLVKLGDSWSISLDGPEPEVQGVSLTAPPERLQETLAEAVSNNGPVAGQPTLEELEAAEGLLVEPTGPTSAPPNPFVTPPETASVPPRPESGHPAGAATESKAPTTPPNHYDCPSCGRSFKVIYDAQRNEPLVKAPIACPHCWQMTKVSVTEGAASTEQYRAEALSG